MFYKNTSQSTTVCLTSWSLELCNAFLKEEAGLNLSMMHIITYSQFQETKAGNYINKYSRELPVEEFFGPCAEDCGCFKAEGILGKYQSILTGADNTTNVLRISREDTISLMIEYANFNPALKKIKKEFTQKEAKQLYVMVKSLLSQ